MVKIILNSLYLQMEIGNPGDIPGTSLWDGQDLGRAQWWWESLGHPGDSRWDCGTDRTLGEPNGGGDIPGTPGGTVGQTGPWESPMVVGIPGTPGWTVGQTGPWESPMVVGIPGTPGGTVGQTGPWESPMVVGTSRGLPVGLWDRQDLGRAQWWWVPLGHPVVPLGLGDGKDSGTMVPLVGHGSLKDSHGPPGTRGYLGRTWDCDGKPGHECLRLSGLHSLQ